MKTDDKFERFKEMVANGDLDFYIYKDYELEFPHHNKITRRSIKHNTIKSLNNWIKLNKS